MIGLSITGVYWVHDNEPGYARYFISLSSGETYEVRRSGVQKGEVPLNSTSMEDEFGPILSGPGIAGIYMLGSGSELAIILLSGHYLNVFGTFDGTNTGNNFVLHSPPHEEDWVGEIQRDWKRTL